MKNSIQDYINHIAFVIDRSGSMQYLEDEVVKVFDSQIKHLAQRSKELNQETRVSVYLFNSDIENLLYDMDVLRLPSLKNYYRTGGQTNLIGATLKAIEDLGKIPQLYGDGSYLIYVISDGMHNIGFNTSSQLSNKISNLPENWTIAAFVPNQDAVYESKKFGFFSGNISIWRANVDGINEVGNVLRQTTDNYMRARATGVRGTKSLFNIDTSVLKANVVKNVLDELKPYEYDLFPVHKDTVIKDFVERWTGSLYAKGSTYYQLTKPEDIQSYKQICVQNKLNGKVYGGLNARNLLKLPNSLIRVHPVHYSEYDIFVQSTSLNRKLIKDTKVIVLK